MCHPYSCKTRPVIATKLDRVHQTIEVDTMRNHVVTGATWGAVLGAIVAAAYTYYDVMVLGSNMFGLLDLHSKCNKTSPCKRGELGYS